MSDRALATVAVPEGDAEAFEGMVEIEIREEALYDAFQVGLIVGVRTSAKDEKTRRRAIQNHVYALPEAELPVTWVGPNRGLRRYRGRDILAYLEAGRSDGGGG